mmetsp:Transcript_128929/g.223627  ORF Transcript_128929/g.223627 Transcript_128929/m.223627 type:complete len:205 (-) Transcript_128929:100-714(-)
MRCSPGSRPAFPRRLSDISSAIISVTAGMRCSPGPCLCLTTLGSIEPQLLPRVRPARWYWRLNFHRWYRQIIPTKHCECSCGCRGSQLGSAIVILRIVVRESIIEMSTVQIVSSQTGIRLWGNFTPLGPQIAHAIACCRCCGSPRLLSWLYSILIRRSSALAMRLTFLRPSDSFGIAPAVLLPNLSASGRGARNSKAETHLLFR